MPKRGLPETLRMRHDAHYVETLAASAGAPVGRLVPIDQVDPNPDQPRQAMGDLAELVSSVTEKGIIEPLVVRQRGPRYQIIAGERRYHAAVQAGLMELPVVIRDVDDREMLELALVENIQRKDLTPFEEVGGDAEPGAALRLHPRGPGQATGQVPDDDYRGVVVERDSSRGPQSVPAGGHCEPIAVIANRPARRLAKDAGAGGKDCEPGRHARAASKGCRETQSRTPKAFVFAFRPPSKAFNLRLSFNKKNASKDEVIAALENIIHELKKQRS